jgi:molybdopterin-guanine dinucleotide biosynthesis protein
MSSAEPFIISVTGAHSGVGKTTVCTILLKEIRGFGAIKFTKTPLYTSMTDDPAILREKGKDTSRFIASGAQKVIWIQSSYNDLARVLDLAMDRMKGLGGVVVEGNSPVDFLNPHLILFIIDEDGEIKPSAGNVSTKADIVIVNSEKKHDDPAFLSGIVQPGIKVFWIDLLKNSGETNEFISYVRERINKGPRSGKGI